MSQAPVRPTGPQRATLRQVKPRGEIIVFAITPDQVTPGGGVGGWARVTRPRRTTATEWEALPERTLSFPVFFDGWPSDGGDPVSVERECRILEKMGEPAGPRQAPPELEFTFGRLGRNTRWVIDSLERGEALFDPNLHRVRADFTVTLLQKIDAEATLTAAEKHREKGKGDNDNDKGGKSSNRIIVARAGDTLTRLAARELGDPNLWTVIAELNELRDPNLVPEGLELKLPEA